MTWIRQEEKSPLLYMVLVSSMFSFVFSLISDYRSPDNARIGIRGRTDIIIREMGSPSIKITKPVMDVSYHQRGDTCGNGRCMEAKRTP